MTSEQLKTRRELALKEVLWRLGIDTDLSSFDDNSLVAIHGVWPNYVIVTRLRESTDLYPLLTHENTIVQGIRVNQYNCLTFEVQIGENSVL
jgi:hypothetical protein